jgi:DNA-binding Xre family transcriptional regulator
MLALNIGHVLQLRGITNSFTWLTQNGFSSDTAHRILNNKGSHIKMAYLEKLCLLLHCTPNELLEWKPSEKQPADKQHPLNKLVRTGAASVTTFLQTASLEEIEKLHGFIAQIKNP